MRRNVAGRAVGPDGSYVASPGEAYTTTRRGSSPPPLHHGRHLSGQHFSRKHAVLLTLVFFFVVWAARSWRGALREAAMKQNGKMPLPKVGNSPQPPLPLDSPDDASSGASIWRGSHQSLSQEMDATSSVLVCGEGQLFYVDANEHGWPAGEFLDSIEEDGAGGNKEECCKVCTENENCNAFVLKAKICSLYKLGASASNEADRSLAERQVKEKTRDENHASSDENDHDSILPDLPEADALEEEDVLKPTPIKPKDVQPALPSDDDAEEEKEPPLLLDHDSDDIMTKSKESAAPAKPRSPPEVPVDVHVPGFTHDAHDPDDADRIAPVEENVDEHEQPTADDKVIIDIHPKHEKGPDQAGAAESDNTDEEPDLVPLSEVDAEDDGEEEQPSKDKVHVQKVLDEDDNEADIPEIAVSVSEKLPRKSSSTGSSIDEEEDDEALPSLPGKPITQVDVEVNDAFVQPSKQSKRDSPSLDDLLQSVGDDEDDGGDDLDVSLVKQIPSRKQSEPALPSDADDDEEDLKTSLSIAKQVGKTATIPDLPEEDDDAEAVKRAATPEKKKVSIPDLPDEDDDIEDSISVTTPEKKKVSSSTSRPDVDDDDEGVEEVTVKKTSPLKPALDDSDEDDDDIEDEPVKSAQPRAKQKSILDLELEGGGDHDDDDGAGRSLDDLLSDVDDDDDEEAASSFISDLVIIGTQAATTLTETKSKVASKSSSAVASQNMPTQASKIDTSADDDMDEIFPQASSPGEILLSNEANAKVANNPIRNILAPGVYGVTVMDTFYQQKSKYFGRFRAVSEIHDFLAEWQAEYSKPGPGRNWQVDLFTLGKSGEGKMIKAVEFGNPSRGKHVFVIGGLRGCDWVAPLAIVHSAVALVGRKRSTAHLLDAVRFHFVPLVNVDGYHYSRRKSPASARHWCDNRRISGGGHGVNLERNWGEDGQSWGFGKKGKDGRKDKHGFQGLTGFSEPETKIVREYIEHYTKGSGRVAVLHVRCCGGSVAPPMLFGARAKDAAALTTIAQGTALIAANIRTSGEGKDYAVVKRPDSFSIENTGQLIDWTASLGVDHSYALEIKALSVATYNDRYQINPEAFMSLSKELEVGIVTTAQLLLQQPVQGQPPESQLFRPKISSSTSSSSTSSSSSSMSKSKKKSTTAR